MADADINAFVLRSLFHYDRETGKFYRNGQNKESGRLATKGYRQISVNGTRYMAHRLAWLYVYGEWPENQIDHINQNKDDNRIENLRVVTNKQNSENVTIWKHNKTGRRGVRFRHNRFFAEIIHYQKTYNLGWFDNIVDAVAARIRAERELYTHSALLTGLLMGSQAVDFASGSLGAPGTMNAQ